jgi:hypothetical protein
MATILQIDEFTLAIILDVILVSAVLFTVYFVIPFLRRYKKVIYDADRHKIYWAKPKFDKKNLVFTLRRIPIDKELLKAKLFVIKEEKLYPINPLEPNGATPYFSVKDVEQLMNQKVLAELYRASMLEFIIYIVIGIVIGLPFGILIGHFMIKT